MEHVFVETKMMLDDAGAISGIGWKFGVPDRIGDDILPGAFKGARLPVPMLFGHDLNDPIGTWDTLTEKSDGLHLSGRLLVDEVPRAREVRALVKSGAVKGLSIGFISKSASSRAGGGRTIKSLELLEVSLVTIGLHPGAKVTSAKSAVTALNLAAAINRAAAHIGRS
ncbi:HK97 family phage prohead protease [Rhizobium sp. YJ-22]|uniref:HK97 family phage prohead protease n=1 Tax=Rhizobium sp. YJ-22 TaxID=3037556 RepID=UPI0024122059|nr:HK97 family phage prohead protease [Rhizobium sp. YJ-22]MDG3575719.1 HK97 family phage prohead protease [Rhizobium sp. YJ-22]